MPLVAKHLTVRGRVQGVCFRAWTLDVASSLGLCGWVRNRANGDVEAVVEGDATAVETFLSLVWDGPPAARVESVQVNDRAASDLAIFELRGTI